MRCLVTGGSGFIGSNLIVELLRKQRVPINIDSNLPKKYIPSHIFKCIDITKLETESFRFNNTFDVVYHLAADTSLAVGNPKAWFLDSDEMLQTNMIGTYNILRATLPSPIIFTGTAALYGEGEMFTETSPIRCDNYYGYSKAGAERLIEASGRDYIIYRLGTVIGRWGRTFPNRLVWAATKGVKVKIFNKGENVRSFLDVRDLTRAFTSYMPGVNCRSGTYNLAGETHRYADVANMVNYIGGSKFGCNLDYELVPHVPTGLAKTVSLNSDKFLLETGWKPKYRLSDSIEEMFKHYTQEPSYEPQDWGGD